MIIEEENDTYKNKMKKIYESIKSNPIFKKHINFDRTERIKFIQNYPYDNIPFNDNFLFNNICMFNDLSCVNGSFLVNKMKMVDFNGNYKINDNINISQRCVLPLNIFMSKYNYINDIPPLKKEELKEYLIK